ncbi:HVA1 family protein, partial [Agrobacterium pusense]
MVMSGYRKGTKVRWNWGTGTGEGKILEVFTEDVERTISGS